MTDKTIGTEQIRQAQDTLRRYKQGKANLEQRIVDNEQWYKLRHWECMRKEKNDVEPASGWLFNAIANKHADAMDNYPAPNILPRESSDKAEAELLSAIVPAVLEQNDFEEVYDRVWDYKLKAGTGVYGVFWDKNKLGGLGDISICKVDLINLFWESGITDIQRSRNVFHVELVDDDLLLARYPALEGKLGGAVDISRYVYDDAVDTTGKSPVVDWYYKKLQGGRTVLHYCKFVGDEVLFATENEVLPVVDELGAVVRPAMADTGWYDHGLYPFVFDPLFSVEGTPCGFGYIDVGKSAQEYIDRGNQAILQNLLANTRPRHFIRTDGSVNEAEYADLTKDFVHVDGNLGQDSILPIVGKPLNSIYLEVIRGKVEELKEVTGNRDISTGGTTAGVTAASAIAAMQEAGSKLSRDNNKASYRAFRKVIVMVIELIRQFYDLPRCFRIAGSDAANQFISYSNAGIRRRDGVGPLFDVQVSAQRRSPYSRMSQNELALQFYSAGFFDPAMASQALACLDMMDFDRKEFVMGAIARNGAAYAGTLAAQGAAKPKGLKAEFRLPKEEKTEPAAMKKARQRAADSASPT